MVSHGDLPPNSHPHLEYRRVARIDGARLADTPDRCQRNLPAGSSLLVEQHGDEPPGLVVPTKTTTLFPARAFSSTSVTTMPYPGVHSALNFDASPPWKTSLPPIRSPLRNAHPLP